MIIGNVKNMNKIGLLVENGPLTIVVIKNFTENLDIFEKIEIDTKIKMEIVTHKIKIGEK